MLKLHDRVLITTPVTMFQSNGVLSESYDNFMSAAYLRFQIRNLMSSRKNTLKKCYPLRLAEEENLSFFNSNSYLEILWKEICLVGPVDRTIWLLIAFHFIALLIAFLSNYSKIIFKRITFRTNCFIII